MYNVYENRRGYRVIEWMGSKGNNTEKIGNAVKSHLMRACSVRQDSEASCDSCIPSLLIFITFPVSPDYSCEGTA